MEPGPDSHNNMLPERFIGSREDDKISGKALTDRNIFTARRFVEHNGKVDGATMARVEPSNAVHAASGKIGEREAVLMPEEEMFTLDELEEMAEYKRIVKFSGTVLAGKHPRIKIPAQIIRQSPRYVPFHRGLGPRPITRTAQQIFSITKAMEMPFSAQTVCKFFLYCGLCDNGANCRYLHPNNTVNQLAKEKLVKEHEKPKAISNINQRYTYTAEAISVEQLEPETAKEFNFGSGPAVVALPRPTSVMGQNLSTQLQPTTLYSLAAESPRATKEPSRTLIKTERQENMEKQQEATGARSVVVPVMKSEPKAAPQEPRLMTLFRRDAMLRPALTPNATEALHSHKSPSASSPTKALNDTKRKHQPLNINKLTKGERKLYSKLQRAKQYKSNIANPNSKAKVVERAKRELLSLETMVRRFVATRNIAPEKLDWLMKGANLL